VLIGSAPGHLVCQRGGRPKYQVLGDVTPTPIEENWRKYELFT